jgi:uncharacterized protein with LGFP repeats
MTEVRGERNDFSGEAHGHVVQAGAVHGDIRLDLSPDRIELLSAHGLLPRLAEIPADEAAIKLAMVDAGKAAEVIAMMPEARRIAIIPYIDSASANQILRQLPSKVSSILYLAARAAWSISSNAARWHHLLGDASGDLCRTEGPKGSPAGFFSRYDRGVVFWSEKTGTGMLAGAIEKYYWELDGFFTLGYPIDCETRAVPSRFGTSGTYQRFECPGDDGSAAMEAVVSLRGTTVHASMRGVFATWGDIDEYYKASGGTPGPLGFPLSEDMQVPLLEEGRYRQQFEGGTVYWSELNGAACVQPPIREVYEQSLLKHGMPIGDQHIAAQSPRGTTGVFQRFQGKYGPAAVDAVDASIYASTSRGTWSVSGLIFRYYQRSGETGGPLGFPTASVRTSWPHPTIIEFEQHFESGAILEGIESASDVVGVVGKVYELWCAHRDELGLPKSDERMLEDGPDLVQFFQRGVISVVDGTAKLWLLPAGD